MVKSQLKILCLMMLMVKAILQLAELFFYIFLKICDLQLTVQVFLKFLYFSFIIRDGRPPDLSGILDFFFLLSWKKKT